jgi:pimeloyl-ACP methyl ester carboxylesterase
MRVEVEGVRLFVDTHGTKLRSDGSTFREVPTVVIVHTGPGNDHTPYRAHIGPALAQGAQVLYVDLRGFGRSDMSSAEHWHTEQWARDLRAVLEALGIERPAVLGAGWGCFTALRFASTWPDGLSKLALVNPAARMVVPRIVAAFDEVGGPEAGEAAFAFHEHPSEATIAQFMRTCFHLMVGSANAEPLLLDPIWNWDVAVSWAANEMRTLDLRDDLARITVPTAIHAGTRDPQYPRASIEEVVEAIPHASVRWYDGARHSVFRDRPSVNSAIRSFVTGT